MAAVAEEAIRASRSELLETCTARAQELGEQRTLSDQDAAEDAARTREAARSTVDVSRSSLEEVKASMGERAGLIQAGVGEVDVYTTILAKTEQRLVADREFVASEV